jgi:hypothetical protein
MAAATLINWLNLVERSSFWRRQRFFKVAFENSFAMIRAYGLGFPRNLCGRLVLFISAASHNHQRVIR